MDKHNVKFYPLINPKRVLFPPSHIKLSLIKQFVKALVKAIWDKDEAGVFIEPQVRKII